MLYPPELRARRGFLMSGRATVSQTVSQQRSPVLPVYMVGQRRCSPVRSPVASDASRCGKRPPEIARRRWFDVLPFLDPFGMFGSFLHAARPTLAEVPLAELSLIGNLPTKGSIVVTLERSCMSTKAVGLTKSSL
jgi:hypothetical protein